MPGISEKYLKYRGSPEQLRIEHDDYCASCGYNVRGLMYGRNCPECGAMIEAPMPGAGEDPMLAGPAEQRGRWRLGLALATIGVFQYMVVRVVAFIGLVLTGSSALALALLVSGALAAILWVISGRLLTPEALDARWPSLRPIRLSARYLQLAWLPGYALLAIRINGGLTANVESLVNAASLGLRGVGGLGVILLIMLLQRVAREAELERTDTRFATVLWLLPIVATISALLPPVFTWIAAILIFFLVLVPWTWLMLWLTLALFEMYQHVAWSLRHAADRHDRARRIAESRRELDEQASMSIRAVRASDEEIPIEPAKPPPP